MTTMHDAPGACDLCRDLQRGAVEHPELHYVGNHFACGACPEDLLAVEERGEASCFYSDGRWQWDVYGDGEAIETFDGADVVSTQVRVQ